MRWWRSCSGVDLLLALFAAGLLGSAEFVPDMDSDQSGMFTAPTTYAVEGGSKPVSGVITLPEGVDMLTFDTLNDLPGKCTTGGKISCTTGSVSYALFPEILNFCGVDVSADHLVLKPNRTLQGAGDADLTISVVASDDAKHFTGHNPKNGIKWATDHTGGKDVHCFATTVDAVVEDLASLDLQSVGHFNVQASTEWAEDGVQPDFSSATVRVERTGSSWRNEGGSADDVVACVTFADSDVESVLVLGLGDTGTHEVGHATGWIEVQVAHF